MTKTKNSALRFTVAVFAVLLLCGAASAADVAPAGPTTVYVTKANDDWTYTAGYAVSNAYLIENESNWRYVVNDVNTNYASSPYKNANLTLACDIVFTGAVPSLGNGYSCPFTGTIYGNGKKFINFTQSGDTAYGLIGLAKTSCVLNNVHLYNSSIASSSNSVGGLIGTLITGSVVRLCGCSVSFSNVTTSKFEVGGMVGCVAGPTELWVNASWVDHAYVTSSNTNTVGGLVGVAGGNSKVYVTDSKVNCSEIYAGKSGFVGGVVGHAYTGAIILMNVTVSECKVWSGNDDVGGLCGGMNVGGIMNGCVVENCTVMSYSTLTHMSGRKVGGLVGYAGGSGGISFAGTQTWVNATWVSGNSDVGSLFGSSTGITVISSAPNHSKVYSTTTTGSTVSGVNNNFDGASASPESANIGSIIDLKPLIAGKDYGYGSAPSISTHTVNIDTGLLYGMVNAVPNATVEEGTDIIVTAVPNPGYHLNRVYYHNPVLSSEKIEIIGGKFNLPAYDVTVSGDFEPNQTMVIFHLNTSTESKLNTYGTTNNFSDALTKQKYEIGYTNYWNVSSTNLPLTSGRYVSGVNWNYTGENGGVLDVYANRTVYSKENLTASGVTTFNDNANVVKIVAIQNASTAVTAVNITYEPNTAGPSSDGSYTRTALTPMFNITLTGDLGSDNATVVFNLTTAELNGASPSNIYLAHKKNGVWEYLKPSYTQTGDVYTFTVTGVDSFSPFVPISMTAIPAPAPAPQSSSHSSRNDGTSIWLTATPTPVPTDAAPAAQPTQGVPSASPVKPQPTQTSSSPAPFVGILAGLGAAAVFFALRRR